MRERMDNGVRARIDGLGDGWANAHRVLGPTFNMQDLDHLFGTVEFGMRGANLVFAEYVPDNYANRDELLREFRLIALFDRKYTLNACQNNPVSTAFYLWLCRNVARGSSAAARFFFVVGQQNPPWRMDEIDVSTGLPTGAHAILRSFDEKEWRAAWDALGLTRQREIARHEVDPF